MNVAVKRATGRRLVAGVLAAALLTPIGLSVPASALPGASAEFRINTTTLDYQREPSVAMDADGDYLIAWSSFVQDGSGWGVYAQRYAADGTPRGTETRVNTTTFGDQNDPSVAMDADGDYLITWASWGQDGSGTGVYAQRYAADGTPHGTETRVNTTTLDHQREPSVAMDADGDYLITWASLGQDGSGYGVYAQRYAADGTPHGTETRVNTTTLDYQREPSVAMDADGDYLITWASFWQDGGSWGVYAQRYAADGTPRGTEIRINATTLGDQREPSVAMDADGDYLVTWASLGQDGSGTGVYAQRYAADGTPHGTETRINTTTLGDQREPSVAMDADGDYLITWASLGQDGSGWGVYAQRYAADGTPHGTETRINATTLDHQHEPSVAMDADGDLLVAWSSENQDGGGTGVYARRVRGPDPIDLAVTQSDNADPVPANGRVTYRVRVSNRNEESGTTGIDAIDSAIGAASNVRINLTLPDGATFHSYAGTEWACGTPGATMVCRLTSTLPAGTTAPGIAVTYTAPTDARPAINVVRVTSRHLDPTTANNQTTESTSVLCSLQFSAPDYAKTEAGNLTATVTRTGTDCGTSSVAYGTANASAEAGSDFSNVAGTLIFDDADSTKDFTIPLIDDGLDEVTEQFNLLLSHPTGALLGNRSQAGGTILDNDDAPRINYTTTSSSGSEPGALVDLTVRLSEISGRTVTVVLAKAGSATFLTDYFAPKRLTIPARQLTADFTVEIADDATVEGDELAVIALAAPNGAVLGSQKTHRVTILDDD